MEPMIIFVAAHDGDYIKITAAEFEQYIKKAYETGVEDGKKQVTYPTITRDFKPHMPLWNDRVVYCDNKR